MNTSEMIRKIREDTGWNRKVFSENMGIPIRTLEDWESGRRKPPDYVPRLLAYSIRLQSFEKTQNHNSSSGRRRVNIVEDEEGKKIVLINDRLFRGMDKKDWQNVEIYLADYVGKFYEIAETSDIIYIDKDFPDEYANSKERIKLKGANRRAKANASQGIPELIQIASQPEWEKNKAAKHDENAKFGWYRYTVRFALPVYDDKSGELVRYNVFIARMLVRHAEDGRKYLYDILAIKKENEKPI